MHLWRRLETCARVSGYGLAEPVPDATDPAEDRSGSAAKAIQPDVRYVEQLACRATRPDQARLVSKLVLAKLLKHWGYSVEQRFQLMLLIDTLLTLPEPLEDAFYDAAQHIEDEHTMERLNSFQRVSLLREKLASEEIGMQKGLQAGLAQGIQEGIEQGAHTGIAGMLHTLLQQKFGDLHDVFDS